MFSRARKNYEIRMIPGIRPFSGGVRVDVICGRSSAIFSLLLKKMRQSG
jgi:hypothetical protein